jgi:hypothetical protein
MKDIYLAETVDQLHQLISSLRGQFPDKKVGEISSLADAASKFKSADLDVAVLLDCCDNVSIA